MARRRPPIDPDVVVPPVLPPHPSENFGRTDAAELRELLEEKERRDGEALRLYQALPKTQIFHESRHPIKLIIGSNRAGKTLGAAAEVARCFCGQDPIDKYPKTNGVAFVFGINERHLGNVMYQKLFRPGAFRMIRDEATKAWRVFRPIEDAGREKDRNGYVITKPAPPLIPRRLVKSIAWRIKKSHIPTLVTLTNGWEIHFYSTNAELPRGQDIDLAWIDEEVGREDLIEELLPRLADRRGKLIWSATPQVASAQLYDLHERADGGQPVTENASASLDGDVLEVHCHIKDNPHIPEEEKQKLYRGWSEEQRRVRWDGKFAFTSFLVYPEFSLAVHAWPQPADWQVPKDWSRFISVDPGRQRCAVVFVAKPPPYVGNFLLAYDEIYMKDADAQAFGKALGGKSSQVVYEYALIDAHAGRINEMGSGKNIEVQYQQAMVSNRVHIRNGPYFTWGSDDRDAGIQGCRDLLRIGANNQPGFFVIVSRCPHVIWEFQRYRYKPDPVTKLPSDEVVKKNDHLMDGLRYLALQGCEWRKPKDIVRPLSPAVSALKRKRDRKAAKLGGGKEQKVYSLGMGREQDFRP